MKRFFSIYLIFCFFCISLKAQLQGNPEKETQNHLYSFSLMFGVGSCKNPGNAYHTYWDDLLQGSVLEGLHFKVLPMGDYSSTKMMKQVNVGASLEWRYKFRHPFILNHWEWTTGLGFTRLEGNRSNMVNLDYPLGAYFDTALANSLHMVGFGWNIGASVHTKPFMRDFGIFVGTNIQTLLLRLGESGVGPGVGNIDLSYNNGTRYILSFPAGLKYNASCDLNIEFAWKPGFLFAGRDVKRPNDLAVIHQYGIMLRYKLRNSPTANPNKRVDMFF